ncbi:ATP-dependent RNA helicase dbp4 [Schizosaccharomyces pombe]|uniref:ATP-dependent RNA helicase dbp4 n=1 Tax=Schizosaccharomyces pombe (strain 972 / ATCC 24843) TaxID=284812 RepID=DBP4_SCHPO|nr:putative ATP-dependent RNA helicase Hca4 [Schizosaccharomyces pombe]Q9UTP9.1 RecName: Full=ATP-dependent RNA helicase dbp4 [Schizosaccharomyces pombe 972h-]CAB60250.1 ATP-dependent RNA helicase Hca4 (predicted) [Schizosaccharomyces pombe]|eukprot:NP_594652.1 putative ATP-dependent RNA helicase Hca4 [Schizosaccharomyces pombe]
MPKNRTGRSREAREKKRKEEEEEIEELNSQIEALSETVDHFAELPLTQPTKSALKNAHFITLTEIQKQCIPSALKGRDILGAAKTGSGKTLAFIVPLIENLYRKKWTSLDGLGALVISPTRELAIQTFETLVKIGRLHSFSAGLIIGGNNYKEEKERLSRMNILVCTPGRLLQHIDQAVNFDTSGLQMLILDEADRILDMGFRTTLDAIVSSLPVHRQTMLFSATQTKSVKDLARLSLQNPDFISVHENDTSSTPSNLNQFYLTVPLTEKLDILFGFIRTHLKFKTIVFLSSCKQVRFVYETFRRMRPGISLLHLHGKQKQTTRTEVTAKFTSSRHVVLFCTDIVARGLDFPAVDWVIQLDAPEDVDTYIHRVGRTARYNRSGNALLLLLPSEEAFLKRLESKKIAVERINVKDGKKTSIRNQLQNLCFKDNDIKYIGQKAFISYLRSIYLQKDKDVFQLDKLPVEAFADSLGLPGTPKITFGKLKNHSQSQKDYNSSTSLDSSEESEVDVENKQNVRTKYDRIFERKNQDVLAAHRQRLVEVNSDEDDGDFLQVKRVDHDLPEETGERFNANSKRKEKMASSKKAMLKYKKSADKVYFDDEGNAIPFYAMNTEDTFQKAGDPAALIASHLAEERKALEKADITDKETVRQKQLEKKRRRQELERITQQDATPDEYVPEGPIVAFVDDELPETSKKQKKWFEDNDERDHGGIVEVENLNSLEDQEALALKLMGAA